MNGELDPSATPDAPDVPDVPASFRRLAWNQMVKRGDYVKDGKIGFKPWVGPAGFHADSFIETIYRKCPPRLKAAQKPV